LLICCMQKSVLMHQAIAPSHRDLNPIYYNGFLGPPEFSTQTASRSVQPFLHSSRPYTLQWAAISPSKLPFRMGDLDLHLIYDSLGLSEPITQTASRLNTIGSAVFAQLTAVFLYFAMPPPNYPFAWGIWTSI